MTKQFDGEYILGRSPLKDNGWESLDLKKGFVLSYTKGLNVFYSSVERNIYAILGYIYNPHCPDQTEKEIVEIMSQATKPDEFISLLYTLAGCYVVICSWEQTLMVFTDAASLRKFYYLEKPQENRYIGSSSDKLLAKINHCPINKSLEFKTSSNMRIGSGSYLPGSLTSYEGILHLTPHHFFSLSDNRAIRYFPKDQLKTAPYERNLEKASKILIGSAKSVLIRFPRIALALTGGCDSRTSLAAFLNCTDNHNQIETFTFQYPYLDEFHADLKVAKEISQLCKINHHTLLIDVPSKASKVFVKTFELNTPLVVSTIADIYRVFYRLPGIALNPHFMLKKERIPESPESLKALNEWFSFFEQKEKYLGYNLFDLFYWENRIARWGTKGFSGTEIQHIKLNIFNSQELLDTVLQINPKFRRSGKFSKDLIDSLYPGLTSIPFNPPQSIGDRFKKVLKNIPGEKWLRYLKILTESNIK